jgi:hypothetical protein
MVVAANVMTFWTRLLRKNPSLTLYFLLVASGSIISSRSSSTFYSPKF